MTSVKGGEIGVTLALAGLALVACIVMIGAGGADATVVGKAVPPAGSDWVIDLDTWVFAEDISLTGNLMVVPGCNMSIANSTITIGSSTAGEHGILVQANLTHAGSLMLAGSTVRAEDPTRGYTLTVQGTAILGWSSLLGVHNGLRLFGDAIVVDGCVVEATGTHGLYIEGTSPTVTATRISLATQTQGCGVEVRGTPSDPAAPELQDLLVNVAASTSVTTSAASYTVAFSVVGLRADGADLGTVSDLEVVMGEGVVATLTSTGTPKLTVQFSAVGLQLEGQASVTGFENVTVRGDGYVANVTYAGTKTATLVLQSAIIGLNNVISAQGESPDQVSGLAMHDHAMEAVLAGSISLGAPTMGAYAIAWNPSPLASPGGSLTVSGSTFERMQLDALLKTVDLWNVTLRGIEVYECAMVKGVVSLSSWTHDLSVQDCTFEGNAVKDGAGDLVYATRMAGAVDVTGCTFASNTLARAIDIDGPSGPVITLQDNHFDGNNHTQGLVTLSGLGVLGITSVTVEGNTFVNDVTLDGLVPLVLIEHPMQDVTVGGNSFSNCTGSGIVFLAPYTNTASLPDPDFQFTVEDNDFDQMAGNAILFTNVDNSAIIVRDNTATGCALYALAVEQTLVSLKVTKGWGTFQGYVQGPDSLLVEGNWFSGNPGGGAYLATSRYESSYSSQSGNPYQSVMVRGNDLTDNGIGGWAISLVGLYNRPEVEANDVNGSDLGIYMAIIPDELKRSPFVVIYDGLLMDGGTSGARTGLSLNGIGAVLYNCSFKHYQEAIHVENAEASLLWSELPVGSGLAEGGTISVYNRLEIDLRWADASGADSGRPVPSAGVSLTTASGLPVAVLTTDASGMTPAVVLKVWESVYGTNVYYSPFKVATLYDGQSLEQWLDVYQEMTGADRATILLVDRDTPLLTVSSPRDGSVLASGLVVFKGTLFDFGSGVMTFKARHDGMAPGSWVDIPSTTRWAREFTDLTDGPHTFTVRAVDVSNNVNETTIVVTVDTVAPILEAHLAFLDGTPIPYDEARGGHFTSADTILIVGTYADDIAPLDRIAVRLDGKVQTATGGQPGKITLRVTLMGGMNPLLLDVTDEAGNRDGVGLMVTLDKDAPVLYILRPSVGLETRHPSLVVEGLTEPSMRLRFVVESVQGSRVYEEVDGPTGKVPILSGPDGTFSFTVELYEGSQVLQVSAEDAAGNVKHVEMPIVLDTQPPAFDITSPTEPTTITREATWTITGTLTKELDATVLINGQVVANPGTFSYRLVLHEGDNPVEVVAVDAVGNSHTRTFTIIRDTAPPTLELDTVGGGLLITRVSTVGLTGHAWGALSQLGGSSGVFVEVGGTAHAATLASGTWDDGEWEYSLTLRPTDLDQVITVRAVDEAGNVASIDVRVVYDVIPPSLAIDTLPATTTTPEVTIEGTTDESVRTVWVEGMAFDVVDGAFSVRWLLSPGENVIHVEVRDDAGNVQATTVSTVLEWKEAGPRPTGEEGSEEGSVALPLALIVAGVTVLAVAMYLTRASRRGVA